MSEAATALINAALAAPKTHAVLTVYEDGRVKRHDTRSLASAQTFATGERRKVGRPLIDRDTGATVSVASVEIVGIA